MLSDYPMAARDAFGSLLKAINSSVALVWRTIKDKSGTTDGQSRRHNLPRLGVWERREIKQYTSTGKERQVRKGYVHS